MEGNCWANNHRGLFPLWDNNIAISFHNEITSISLIGSIPWRMRNHSKSSCH
ncbi:hypothetical protein [Klebsiella pneumoniae]|uniref:hypothetical protein n=1 Tax=Klebsiella pneumoniae TaxID=573 RepID=UPI003A854535